MKLDSFAAFRRKSCAVKVGKLDKGDFEEYEIYLSDSVS